MASFDPSIISQIPDFAPNPVGAQAKAFKLSDLMTQQQSNKLLLGEQQKQIQDRAKAEQIMRDFKGPIDKPEGQVQLANLFREAGLSTQANQALQLSGEQTTQQLQQDKLRNEALQFAVEFVGPRAKSALEALDGPGGIQAAHGIYKQAIEALPQQYQGKFPPELPNDPVEARKLLMQARDNSKRAQELLTEESNRQHQRKDEQLGQERVDVERARLAFQKQQAGTAADMEPNAQAVAAYKEAPPVLSSRNPRGYALMARVMEINPDYDANLYKTRGATEKAFATGKQADTVRSLNVAVQHLNQLSGLGQDLKNTDVRSVNKFYNALGKEFGQANVTNFETAKSIVADEVVKAVIGSGAGALTDREDLQSKFTSASTPEQLMGVIKTAKGLMAGQLKGLRQQYESGTGRTDFEGKLSSETKAALESDTGGEVKPFSDPEKERRYQEWKKTHGG